MGISYGLGYYLHFMITAIVILLERLSHYIYDSISTKGINAPHDGSFMAKSNYVSASIFPYNISAISKITSLIDIHTSMEYHFPYTTYQ